MSVYLLASVTLLVLGLGVAYSERKRWLRWVMLAITLIAVPATYIVSVQLMGTPKPVKREYFNKQTEVLVVGYKLVDKVALYILLDHKDWPTPLYYSLEWKDAKKVVKGLQDRMAAAKRTGQKVLMVNPFDPSAGQKVKHPDPPTRDPLKDE